MPIGIEAAGVNAIAIAHLIKLHFRMPHFHWSRLERGAAAAASSACFIKYRFALNDADIEEPLRQLEHATKHLGHTKIRTPLLRIEFKAFMPALLAPVRDLPWLQGRDVAVRLVCAIFLKCHDFPVKRRLHLR